MLESASSFHHPLEMTNRVRHSKQRLASKQLSQPADIPSNDNTQPVGTWLNPAAPPSLPPPTDKDEEQQQPNTGSVPLATKERKTDVFLLESTLRRSMSETRLSSFALKVLNGKIQSKQSFVRKRIVNHI